MSWLAQDVSRIAGRDPGVGEQAVKKHLNDVLKTHLGDGTRDLRRLEELAAMAADGYLTRWRRALESGAQPSVERLSRAVASHLLDRGFSLPYLRRWSQEHVSTESTVNDLLLDAEDISNRPAIDYEVVVPFRAVPGAKTPLTDTVSSWRSAREMRDWLLQNGSSVSGLRQVGGFAYIVRARDPLGAVMLVSDRIDRLISRATLARGSSEPPRPEGAVWVSGTSQPFRLDRETRGTYVLSLVAEARLFDVDLRTELDDALELASVLNLGSPGPAIASGWAAIEALLVSSRDPEDSKTGRGAVAADRLATLVACSWPRAELTALSYQHRPAVPDVVSARIASSASNQERSRAIADALESAKPLALRSGTDRAAAARMSRLMQSQRGTLKDVESHVRSSMRRLYRQRNIVMHGGSTDTLTRDATLRTCAPLVGAGLDRIAHARISRNEDALQLSERARLSLDLVGNSGGPHIAHLLE